MRRLLLDSVTIALLLGLAVIALLAADRPPPLLVDFHRADFPVCVTVPGPLQPHTDGVNLYPRRSDAA